MDVIGYGNCRLCGDYTPEAVLARSNGICGMCVGKQIHPSTPAAVMVEGRVIKVPKRTYGSRGNIDTKRARRAAEEAARRALARRFPATYRALLAEERKKRGLDPFPISPGPVEGNVETETDEGAAVYHLADRR